MRKSPTPRLRSSVVASIILATTCTTATSFAQESGERTESASKVPFIEVRLALSDAAAALLIPRKFRRYLSIELDDAGHVAAQGDGPLNDHVAYVWIDLPHPGRVRIQTRVGRRAVATRSFALRDGLRADVAARIVAIATSEMVRTQAQPLRVRKPKPPKPPTPEQVELATRDNPAVLLAGKASGAWLPSTDAVLGGSTLELSFRMARTRQHLSASWLAGPSDAGAIRWMEAGLGVDRTWWISDTWRFDTGVGAYASLLRVGDATSVDGARSGRDTWSTRAAGRIQVERSLGDPVWIGLALEPGLILRPAPYTLKDGSSDKVDGLFLGLSFSLQLEQRYRGSAFTAVASERRATFPEKQARASR